MQAINACADITNRFQVFSKYFSKHIRSYDHFSSSRFPVKFRRHYDVNDEEYEAVVEEMKQDKTEYSTKITLRMT